MSRSRYLPGWQDSVPGRKKAWVRRGIKGMKRRNREREKQVCREYAGWVAYHECIYHPAMEQMFESKIITKGYW